MLDTPPHSPPGRDNAALSPLRAWSAVIALAVAVFAVTATEMMPIGVLPQITADLGISEGAAGLTVTVYGIVAGLSAPAMTSWTRRIDRRALVLSIIAVFIAGNVATALISSYPVLLVVRLGIGLFHGLMWSIIAGSQFDWCRRHQQVGPQRRCSPGSRWPWCWAFPRVRLWVPGGIGTQRLPYSR